MGQAARRGGAPCAPLAEARLAISTTGGATTTGVGHHSLDCVEEAQVSLEALPAEISFGASSRLSWSVHFPAACSHVNGTLTLDGRNVGLSGSETVQPLATGT